MAVEQVTEQSFEELAKEGKALLDFWAPWCGPCRAAAPIFEEVSEAQGGKARFGKVNVDEEQQLAAKFQVNTIPTFILFENGKEKARMSGLPSKQKLLGLLEQ